jgi:phosphoglycolate phosphatase-like HAD superfamily hydrolase
MVMANSFKTTKSGLIFDFDYTLVDSTEVLNYCVNEVLDRMNHPAATQEQIQSILADPLEDAYVKLTGIQDPAKALQYADLVRNIQSQLTDYKIHFFDGVHERLEKLNQMGIQMGIVSSNDKVNIERFLKQEGALTLFKSIISANEVSVYKPHPQGLYKCLKEMHLTQKDAIFLGDSLHDAGAAKNASVDFMGVLTGHATENCFNSLPHIGIHQDSSSAMDEISKDHLKK